MQGAASRAAWALVVVTACFSPSFDDGQFTCPTGDCPPGFACVEGRCVRDSSPRPPDAAAIDAARSSDDAAALPDAGSPVDARPPLPARVYSYARTDGTWSHVAGADYFAADGAPLADDVRTAWAHCATASIVCVGTEARWYCTANGGGSWFDNTWVELHPLLAEAPPTYSTAWDDAGGFVKDVVFNSAARWWELTYVGRPRDDGGGIGRWNLSLVSWYGAAGASDRDEQWGGEADAPPTAAALIADFHEGADWVLWDAAGTEYRRGAESWQPSVPAPYLALPDAPPAALVTAAASCRDTLLVFTRSE